ncbi:MAG: A/G-specific adenine glycosylase [Flavobacteriaceae bacterium]|nr:A/G-specific adenine glycosylase [Flavobacteriaceae bacterium]
MHFSKKLISWYLENKRDLPWRAVSAPYFIWLSEVILQQTRVAQGLPYYEAFVEAFPTVKDLADAPEHQVLKLWQGLGYYSRARNLHAAAKDIVYQREGNFPNTYNEIITLKGVGDYTASAIVSICFNEPTAVVDGNVFRVLARVFGIATPINSAEGARQFKELAQDLLDVSQPGTHNQALMEFGARFCVPQNPSCESCIFRDSCTAFRTGSVGQLPVKVKPSPVKKRHFNFLVLLSADSKTLLQQRTERGIWQQLYEFPLLETSRKVSLATLLKNEEYRNLSENFGIGELSQYNVRPIVHKLSHQHLHTTFWVGECSALGENGIDFSEVHRYAVPVLIENFIANFPVFDL